MKVSISIFCALDKELFSIKVRMESLVKKIERRQNVVHEKLIPMTHDGEPTCATNVKLIFRRKGLL